MTFFTDIGYLWEMGLDIGSDSQQKKERLSYSIRQIVQPFPRKISLCRYAGEHRQYEKRRRYYSG